MGATSPKQSNWIRFLGKWTSTIFQEDFLVAIFISHFGNTKCLLTFPLCSKVFIRKDREIKGMVPGNHTE